MKRGLIAFAVGSMVFAAVYASAAALTVGTGVLQSGGGDTGTCDDAVAATYTLVWNAATGDYDVDKVTVTGINPACTTSLTVEVDLADAAGASLSHTAVPVAGTASQVIEMTNVSATDVAKTQVAIHS